MVKINGNLTLTIALKLVICVMTFLQKFGVDETNINPSNMVF